MLSKWEKSLVKQVMLGSIGKRQHAIAFLGVDLGYKENCTLIRVTYACTYIVHICPMECSNYLFRFTPIMHTYISFDSVIICTY